jgi:predicted adenine nucleotide alpha hydrolase (AANH) superfamily ATPase
MNVLLHTCCGPCASACIPRLRSLGHSVTLFFANDNIDTDDEFLRRKNAAEILAAHDRVPLVFAPYNHDDWLRSVAAGYENEPEKGERCRRCFRYNLALSARYAADNGFDAFSTSLSVSPHKVSEIVFSASDDARFLRENFKKNDGFKQSLVRSAELGLYRQSYCGCEFSRRAPR